MKEFKIFDDAVTIVVVLIAWEAIRWGLNYGLKKMTGNEYMTRKECEGNHSEEDKAVEKVEREMSVIREILLVIAVKVGVPESEYRKLVR